MDIAGIRGGSAPTLLGETAMKSGVYAHSNWLSDDSQYMYSFEESNIEDINVFDVSDPANPVNVETFQWSGDATGNSPVHNGQVKGDLLHVAYYEAGYRVFDISDPANPVEVGMYETWRDPDGDGTFNKSITGIENGAWNDVIENTFVSSSEPSQFTSVPQAMYWAIVTMTTVGYGDIVPKTHLGKLLSALLIMVGYSLIIVPTGFVSAELVSSKLSRPVSTQACPHCMAEGHEHDAVHCRHCGGKL